MADDRPTYRPRRAAADEPTTSEPAVDRFTDDEARPIYREAAPDADAATVRTPATGTPTTAAPGTAGPSTSPSDAGTDDADESAVGASTRGRLNFTRRAAPVDDGATTLLPRVGGVGPGGPGGPESGGDLDESPRRLGRRARLALLAGALAVVILAGIAVGSAVVSNDAPSGTGSPGQPSSGDTGTPAAAALLDDTSMLSEQGALPIDSKGTWTVGGTVRGPVPDGSGAACLGSNPVEGAPTAQQTISRTLTASGSDAPTALHVAQAYATVEDATQAFASTARALGTCAVTGDWIANGRVVTGLGDEAAAVAVTSTADGQTTRHWVVATRTGRAVDVVDAATPGKKALNVNQVAQALASVVGVQCTTAGGACTTSVTTTDGPPPAGGDEPGFLTTGDLPPAGTTTAPWVGTPVEPPTDDFTGSQCETVSWSTTAATTKSSRVYLLQDVPGIFGLNEITLTARDAASASKLVDKIRSDWTTCKERKLTATVATPTKVTGVATDGAAVSGWTSEIEQKAGSTTTRFRVGIAASGDQVAFVFLNPQKGYDVDADDWNVVAVRAVQRATQQG